MRRSVPLLLGLFMAIGFAGAAYASNPIQIRHVEPGGYPTVGVTVFVEGWISAGGITVTENGRPVQILNVRPLLESGQTIDVVLAIDTSFSVKAALPTAVGAAEEFVKDLPAAVPVGIVTFSNQAKVLLAPTGNHSDALAVLGSITQVQSGTRLFDAVGVAAQLFSGSAQHNIVLLTDGKDTGRGQRLTTAVAAAQKAGAAIFAVGLGPDADVPSLQALATATHGFYFPASTTDLSALYQNLALRLAHQYLILYHSLEPAGAQVTVSVHAGGGSDTSIVLLPRGPAPGSGGSGYRALLVGTWGLAVVLGLAFAAMLLLAALFLGGMARARRYRQLAQRIGAPPNDDTKAPSRPDLGWTGWIPEPFVQVGRTVADVGGFTDSLNQKLERAGLPITPGEVVAGSILIGLAAGIVAGLIFRNVILALVFVIVGGAVPFVLLAFKVRRRVDLLHAQLPDVLMILASSMRAGHSFLQALDTVAKEIGDPSGPEFARVVAEVRLGRRFENAMTALAERIGTDEFKWAMLGVNVQREVGGNLAEVLDNLAETVREREGVRRQIKVLSAEGRFSIRILVVMPFLLTAYLAWVNPSYMKLLWTTRTGIAFMVAGGILMVIGAFWANKVVKIDV